MGEQDGILLLKQNIARSYNWYSEPDFGWTSAFNRENFYDGQCTLGA